MDVISFLVWLLVVGLVFALLFWLIDQVQFLVPYKQIAKAILAVIAIIILLSAVFGGYSPPLFRRL